MTDELSEAEALVVGGRAASEEFKESKGLDAVNLRVTLLNGETHDIYYLQGGSKRFVRLWAYEDKQRRAESEDPMTPHPHLILTRPEAISSIHISSDTRGRPLIGFTSPGGAGDD